MGIGLGFTLWWSPGSSEPFLDGQPTVVESGMTFEAEPSPELSALARLLQEIEGQTAQPDTPFSPDTSLLDTFVLDKLMTADTLAVTPAESLRVSALLGRLVIAEVERLNELGRLDEIDALYEQLTLRMPERAEYFLLLAEHRIRMNNGELALPVLAQVENHHQFGGQARALMDEITSPALELPLAVIPLRRSGDQFLARARLDAEAEAILLLDTGASTTIVSPEILRALGYGLRGPLATFLTAGGPVQAPLVKINSLALDGVAMGPVTVGALGLSRSSTSDRRGRVDGLLGMDFLSAFEFSLDQDASELRLEARRSE